MADHIDTAMDKHLPALLELVRGSLDSARIRDLVRFATASSTVPWRASRVVWPEPDTDIALRQAIVTLETAFEVLGTVEVGLDDLSTSAAADRVRRTADRLVLAYRAAVLGLIAADLPGGADTYEPQPYRQDVVDTVMDRSGQWRLLGTGPIAAATAAARGRERVSDPKGALEGTGLRALIVSTLFGPEVEELDVPALTWSRAGSDRVQLVITRRFFFRPGTDTVGLA